MYTIKYKRNSAALLSEAMQVCLARPGSVQFADAVALAECSGLTYPDRVQIFQSEVPQLGVLSFLRPVKVAPRYVDNTEREDNPGLPMAVIVSDAVDERFPETTGTRYQFVYHGDEVYIMNRFGQTVDLIKPKQHHKAP